MFKLYCMLSTYFTIHSGTKAALFLLGKTNIDFSGQHTMFQFAASQAISSKETFRKYIDSVLSKCAKIRSLVSELDRVYANDEMAKKRST